LKHFLRLRLSQSILREEGIHKMISHINVCVNIVLRVSVVWGWHREYKLDWFEFQGFKEAHLNAWHCLSSLRYYTCMIEKKLNSTAYRDEATATSPTCTCLAILRNGNANGKAHKSSALFNQRATDVSPYRFSPHYTGKVILYPQESGLDFSQSRFLSLFWRFIYGSYGNTFREKL